MGVRAARQLFFVGLALALWSALGRPGWLELVGCYVAGLCLLDLATAFQVVPQLSGRAWLAFAVILALPGVRFAYGARDRIIEEAGLVGLPERVRDQLRVARSPAIAPGLVSTAQPQTFFVHADSQAVSLELGERVRLRAEPLGAGLFRVDYDPRRDGKPMLSEGQLDVQIQTDSRAASRTLQVVTPLAHPRWFCRSPSGQRAAVASEESDELIVVGMQSSSVVRIGVGDGPIDCAFIDEERVAISHRFVPELWVVELGQPASQKLGLEGPLGRLAWDAARAQLLVSRAGARPALLHVAWPGLEAREVTPLAVAVDLLALCDDALITSSRVDASVRRLEREGSRFSEVARFALSRAASSLAVDASAGRVLVTVTDYRAAHSPPQLGNHFVQDQLLVLAARTLNLEQRVLTGRRSERQTKPGDTDQGGSPLGLWPLRDGRLALTFAGTDELWRLSLPQAEPNSLRFEEDGFYTPHGVVELQDGSLWLSSPAAGSLAHLSPGAGKPQIVPLAPSDQKLASAHSDVLARRIGERGFYESTRSGISCQSCHMHADSDFAAYNLGDHRLIPTLSVRGLLATAPYLRDGSYPRISDLDEVAQTLYRGYVRQQPGRRYALQAYVESLPRTLPVHVRDAAAERRGYEVFQRAGCERCHKPPAFTNLGQLPLAALFPRIAASTTTKEQLDVPSLLSVSTAPPYLHDGRASTLLEVISKENPDNLHGNTRNLSKTEQHDLITFLESL